MSAPSPTWLAKASDPAARIRRGAARRPTLDGPVVDCSRRRQPAGRMFWLTQNRFRRLLLRTKHVVPRGPTLTRLHDHRHSFKLRRKTGNLGNESCSARRRELEKWEESTMKAAVSHFALLTGVVSLAGMFAVAPPRAAAVSEA